MEIGLIVLILVSVFLIVLYNGMIKARIKVQESGSTIDILLNKRFDLISNLVEVVKGYSKHEQDVLNKVVELRNTKKKVNKNAYNNELNNAENQLMVIAEAYPDLKADTLYLELMKQMSDIEEQLQAARRFYNANVSDYNNKVETFPSSIMAKMMKAKRRAYFAADEEAKGNVQVKL